MEMTRWAMVCKAVLILMLAMGVSSTRAEDVKVDVDGGQGDGSDNRIEANGAILGVNIGDESDDNEVKVNGGTADNFAAIALDDGDAKLEIELDKAALSNSEMTSEIHFNRTENEHGKIENELELEGNAFKDTRGINQVAQNAGQGSLVQQNFTVQSPVVRNALFD